MNNGFLKMEDLAEILYGFDYGKRNPVAQTFDIVLELSSI